MDKSYWNGGGVVAMVSYKEAREVGSKACTSVLCVQDEYGNRNPKTSGVIILKLGEYYYQSKVCVPTPKLKTLEFGGRKFYWLRKINHFNQKDGNPSSYLKKSIEFRLLLMSREGNMGWPIFVKIQAPSRTLPMINKHVYTGAISLNDADLMESDR